MKLKNRQLPIVNGLGTASRKLMASLLMSSAFVIAACGGGASNNENTSNNPNNNSNNGGGAQTYSGPAPSNSDVQAFRIQLWENIRGNDRCGSCHDVGGQGNSAFADNSDVNAAYSVANGLVNLSDPATSSLVTKFSGAGHFCWESTQSACAAQLQLWIENWASDRNGAGGRTIQLTPPNDENPSPATSFNNTVDASYYSGNNINGFDTNIHNIVTTHCLGCHVPNATEGPAQQPYFAVADPQSSYDTVSSVPLINLSTAQLSRFYTRLANDGHRCWDAGNGVSCSDSAASMLSAINYFITNGTTAPDMTELNSMITSRAVTLFEDGISASGGNRYEASQIALYEFKLGSGDTVIDRSGVSPSMNLTLFGSEGTDFQWLGSWGIRFDTANAKAQAMPNDSAKLHQMMTTTGEYTIEAWVIPGNVTQEDANIVSYSRAADERNFTLGQTLYNYEVYNRNTSNLTDSNGAPLLSTNPDDEDLQAVLQHVVVTYDPLNGRRVYVNGIFRDDVDPIPGETLANWDAGSTLVLGNEVDRSRPWSGTIRLLALHNRVLSDAQIQQNFNVGVGQKFYLMFDISQHLDAECRGADPNPSIDDPVRDPDYAPLCFIYMEAAQFDNSSFLFSNPTFIALDENIDPTGIQIRGMRIGVNGREASNGQAFASINTTIDSSYSTSSGQVLSTIGTVVALENGPSGSPPDQLFLSFEALNGTNAAKDYSESFSTTPEATSPGEKSAVMMRSFEEINATMAEITGVDRTLTAINRNSDLDGGSADNNGTYTKVIQALPGNSEIDSFVPSHQMAVTQLAIEYCNALVEGNGTSIAPGTYFPGVTFNGSSQPNLAFSTQGERDLIINPLLERVFNVDGATELSTMPAATSIQTHLNWLMAGDGGSVTGLNASCSGNCGFDRTMTIIKSTCAAALASAPMLLQ